MDKKYCKKDAKKFYWLKLNERFFEDDTIAWLEEQENGVFYSNFYLKLCLKAIKSEGFLIRNVGNLSIQYDIKKLAEITNVKLDTAIVAMELFKKIGLVEILENGEIYLTRISEMIGSETSKAAIMRKKRLAEKKTKNSGNIVTKELPKCYTEIEKEKDIELEKEINKEKDKKKDESCSGSCCVCNPVEEYCVNSKSLNDYLNPEADCSNVNIYKHFEKCGFIMTAALMGFINEDLKVYSEKWMIDAANECVKRGKINNYGYLSGILQNWKSRGKDLNSVEDRRPNDAAYSEMKSIFEN